MTNIDGTPLSELSNTIETPPPDKDRGTEDLSVKSYRASIGIVQ